MSVSAENISKPFGASSSDEAGYGAMYKASLSDPESFWANQAKRIKWIKPFTRVKNTSFAYPDVSIKWFEDGTLNVCANCVDRHLNERGDLHRENVC
jgi:acetyl-CoA synthetase